MADTPEVKRLKRENAEWKTLYERTLRRAEESEHIARTLSPTGFIPVAQLLWAVDRALEAIPWDAHRDIQDALMGAARAVRQIKGVAHD